MIIFLDQQQTAGALALAGNGNSGGGNTGGSGGSSTPAYSATQRTPLNLILGGGFRGYKVIPVLINYTTVDTDMYIAKGNAGESVYLVGLVGTNAAATKVKFKSGTTEILRLERAANGGGLQGFNPNDPEIICNTEPGEALNLSMDVALNGPMTAYIVIK